MFLKYKSVPLSLCAVLVLLLGTQIEAQTIGGIVVEQVSLAPVPHGVLTLFLEDAEGLTPVGTAASDDDGLFLFVASTPGRYRVQAEHDGLSSALTDVVDVAEGEVVDDVVLLVPSRLMMLAYGCRDDGGQHGSAVVGTVRDRSGGIPLPEAVVTARWEGERGVPGFASGEADAAGRYRLCDLPDGRVSFQASLLGREREAEVVDLSGAAIVIHDIEIALGSDAAADRDVIQERMLVESAAHGFGDLSGQIVDQGTDAPVAHAVVSLAGTGFQGITDGEGHFVFQGLRPGVYELEIRHLGYSVQADEVEVPAGRDVQLRLRIAPRAIEIAGIEVRGRSALDEIGRLTPARRDLMYGIAMAEEERRGATVPDLLRRIGPGLQVTEIHRPDGPPLLCITSTRRIQGLQPRNLPDCEEINPQLVLDGVRIDDMDVLRTLPPSEIESIEFLSPLQAQITHGIGGRTSNGVIVVYTRGRGPYATERRNVP